MERKDDLKAVLRYESISKILLVTDFDFVLLLRRDCEKRTDILKSRGTRAVQIAANELVAHRRVRSCLYRHRRRPV